MKVFSHFLLQVALILLLTSCSSNKLFQLLHQGSIDQSVFEDEISFERPLNLIVIEVEFAGKTRRFLVDSGSPNLIDKSLAEELNLPIVLKRKVTDSNGKVAKLPFSTLDSLTIGSTTYYQTVAVVADLKSIPLLSCLEVDGFIGANLMRMGVWQIDYQQNKIQIVNDRDSLAIQPTTKGVPFITSTQGTPRVNVSLADSPETTAILDLGAAGSLDLSLKSYYNWPNRTERPVIIGYGATSTGLYGTQRDTSRKAISNSLFIEEDSTNYGPIIAEFSSSNSPSLGNGFFEQFRLTLDWKRQEVFFDPQQKEEVSYQSFGFIPSYQNGQMLVGFVWDGSPAAEAGLEVGERILFMNGIDCINITTSSYCRLVNGRFLEDQWERLNIILQKNGTTKKIDLSKEELLK